MTYGRKIAAAVILGLIITTTVVAKPYNCIPCKENNYCIKGIRYECPLDKPVTQGNRKTSEADCMTCVQRNGDETNPVYDITRDDCVSCVEYNSATPYWNGTSCIACATLDSATPYWNGSACTSCYTANADTPYWDSTTSTCTACPTDTAWDTTENACIATVPETTCAFTIPHTENGTTTQLCLVESVDYSVLDTVAPQSAEEETAEFLAKYGIQNVCSYYPDYWAGAMKYCQDKGLRLPTMQELISISEAVYGTDHADCTSSCGSSGQTGCCDYDSLTAANIELLNFLKSGTQSATSITGYFYLWSSAEGSSYSAYIRDFRTTYHIILIYGRNPNNPRALCVK